MLSFPQVSATGMLGSGFRAESLDKAIAIGALMVGSDAGSTDPAPVCLPPGPDIDGDWLMLIIARVAVRAPIGGKGAALGGHFQSRHFVRELLSNHCGAPTLGSRHS